MTDSQTALTALTDPIDREREAFNALSKEKKAQWYTDHALADGWRDYDPETDPRECIKFSFNDKIIVRNK